MDEDIVNETDQDFLIQSNKALRKELNLLRLKLDRTKKKYHDLYWFTRA